MGVFLKAVSNPEFPLFIGGYLLIGILIGLGVFSLIKNKSAFKHARLLSLAAFLFSFGIMSLCYVFTNI
ncbi:hypothetical protein [Peribacillus tepidiphilus]|uniref:hypothetical protein n=1 Tax=Peribacillus tepidiphilus TaxID=2652445 RepID=UPI001291C80E|nr:hypothetical protein [Peribacillus tepidiphilus]